MAEMKTEQMRPTVLVVNDDPKVLELLSVILEQEDYKVMTTGSGQTALEIASRVEPDIVISDVVMPEVDGLELCRRLLGGRNAERKGEASAHYGIGRSFEEVVDRYVTVTEGKGLGAANAK